LADGGVTLVTTHYRKKPNAATGWPSSTAKTAQCRTPQQLRNRSRANCRKCNAPPMKASKIFRKIDGVSGVTAYGTSVHVIVTDIPIVKDRIKEAALREKINITSMEPILASLEDVFATLTEDKP
jgi:hypothetical protein